MPDLSKPDELSAEVDAVIASCDGDARAAVAALIVANSFLDAQIAEMETEIERITDKLSLGFTYGRFRRPSEG